ncbi:hypothetical protein GCM10023224_15710 [Streptomonospora halophila]|uniref:Uncharacterized protein n=1 Tax=Streptomonospora halophila TaxID=427369 RepID=A0ABP9GBN0_9ACTN
MDALTRLDLSAHEFISERDVFRLLDQVQRNNWNRPLCEIEQEITENCARMRAATDLGEWQTRVYYHQDLCELRKLLVLGTKPESP